MLKGLETLQNRWRAKTPIIFSRIIKIAVTLSASAIAIHTTCTNIGIDEPEWWLKAMPYLIGVGIGGGAVAKLTQQYDDNGNPIGNQKK